MTLAELRTEKFFGLQVVSWNDNSTSQQEEKSHGEQTA